MISEAHMLDALLGWLDLEQTRARLTAEEELQLLGEGGNDEELKELHAGIGEDMNQLVEDLFEGLGLSKGARDTFYTATQLVRRELQALPQDQAVVQAMMIGLTVGLSAARKAALDGGSAPPLASQASP